MTHRDEWSTDRRSFLGGLTSLAAATAFSLSMSDAAAAQIQDGDDAATQTVTSPDGTIQFTVDVADGTLSYSVSHEGTTVVADSTLGFEFADQAPLGEGLTVTGSERSSVDETWTPVWDQYDEIRDAHEELRLGLEESDDPGRALTFAVRVFDDGVAFRYLFPENSGLGEFDITAENTEFAFEGDHTSWWIENDYNSYEYEYNETTISDIGPSSPTGGAHTPITMRTDDDRYLAIHEADLVDYAGMGVVPGDDGTTLESDLAPLPSGAKVTAAAPHRTPWRTLQITTRPGALIESSLVLNCNEPRDPEHFPQGVDWIEPGKFIGIWWLMITSRANWQYYGRETANHGANTERMKQYMDFASEHGIRSVLVEGWNEGWDSYPGTGETMDFDDPYEDFDIETVTDYGQQLDPPVEMTAHNETSGNISNYESQLTSEDHPFEYYDNLGIHSIKTGYVADNGVRIDGTIYNHHCQALVNHHHLVYREAAKHRQMLEVHEPIKPTGERRRYPNVMTREGVYGQEYDSFGYVDPSHHVTFPFTRMLAGPVEYTPGIYDMDSGSGGIETTRAKQLAMYPSYLSGLHMVADLPSSYLEDVPATLSPGEVAQGEFAEKSGMVTGARWTGAQAGAYARFDPNEVDDGASLTWTVEDAAAGEYDLHVRYASPVAMNPVGSGVDRTLTLAAGDTETTVTFPTTDFWDEWATVSQTVSLTGEDDTVSLTLTGTDSGGLHVDAVALTEAGASMPDPETDPIRGPTAQGFQFVEDVPAAGWDDTRVVDAEIGEYMVTARSKGEDWYVGVMTGTSSRVLDVPLEFLDSGTYVAEIYTDGEDASYDTNLSDVRRDEALVDADTTLAASVVGSGGMAVRLRPPTGEEADDLPEYERPNQTFEVSIAGEIDFGTPFITVDGSNTGGAIGGTVLEVVVDGELEDTRNVRIPPNTEDWSMQFPTTIENGGEYDVTVRRRDGTTLASQTVSVFRPQSITSSIDVRGDDTGPGSYTYPTGDAYRNDAFDLRRFAMQQTPETYQLTAELGSLYDAQGAENGFSPHALVVYFHDPQAGVGSLQTREDAGVTAAFESPWHYRLLVTGSTATLVDYEGESVVPDDRDIGVSVDGDDLTVELPRSAFGDVDVGTFSVVVGVHAASEGAMLPVAPEAGPDTFGGATSGAAGNAPRVTDVLTTLSVSQSDALSYSADQRATLPYVPLGSTEPSPQPDQGGTPTPTDTATATDAGDATTTAEDGPGFGTLAGILGTAGGTAFALRRVAGEDSDE